MDILRNLYVNISTPEDFAKFVIQMWAGDILSDLTASAVASGLKLGGRAYEAAKIGVKVPLTLLWLWGASKLRIPSDVAAPVALGLIGGVGRDFFKLILGLAPETYGSMLGTYVATWIQTAFGAATQEQPRGGHVIPKGYTLTKSEIASQKTTSTTVANPEELFMGK